MGFTNISFCSFSHAEKIIYHLTLQSQEWSKSNFSLQYQYTAEQKGDEKKDVHQLLKELLFWRTAKFS